MSLKENNFPCNCEDDSENLGTIITYGDLYFVYRARIMGIYVYGIEARVLKFYKHRC